MFPRFFFGNHLFREQMQPQKRNSQEILGQPRDNIMFFFSHFRVCWVPSTMPKVNNVARVQDMCMTSSKELTRRG